MTWDQFLDKLLLAGIGYEGVDVGDDGHIIIHTSVIVKQDGAGHEYLTEREDD